MTRPVPANRWDLLDGRWPADPPRVSVVVLHYDQPAELARTLHALAHQTHPADWLEVVVADDGSAVPPEVGPGVTVVRQADEGFRAARARNLGAAAATGDVLCFLDADSTPEADYVASVSRLPALCPDALVVGRRRHAALDGVPVDRPVGLAGPEHELDEPAWLVDAYRDSHDLLEADDRSYRFVIGATVACHRSLWTATGGFDESWTGYGGEDLDWAYRAWLHGAVLAHDPRAVVWHDGPEWAARTSPNDQRRRKLEETLRLASAVTEPGARPHGLRQAAADTLVRVVDSLSPTAGVVALDGVLAAVPDAVAVVPRDLAAAFPADDRLLSAEDPLASAAADPSDVDPRLGRVRHVVDVLGDVRVDPAAWRAELDAVAPDVGQVVWQDEGGRPLLRLGRVRALRREARWPGERLFERRTTRSPAVEALPDRVTVAGWFAGW